MHLTGTWDQPTVSGQVGIFGLDYGEVKKATAVADFSASPKSLKPKDLLPPQQAQVNGYASYAGALAKVAARFTPPGPEQAAPKVDAEVMVAGLRLATARQLAPKWVPEGTDLEGLVQFTA